MKPGHYNWLMEHFGKCSDDERKECPACKDAGKRQCQKLRFRRKLSPRALKAQGETKAYAPVPTSLFEAWDLGSSRGELDTDSLRVTWGLLQSYTRDSGKKNDTRWVWDDIPTLAQRRGITVETFREHVKELEKMLLIKTFLRRDIDPEEKSNKKKAIVLLDLPSWWPGQDAFKRSRPASIDDDEWEIMSERERDEYVSLREQREAEDAD